MKYRYINCSSILNTIVKPDRLFHGKYTVDPYQYCEFACRYCDSGFSTELVIKKNAVEVLKKELQNTTKGRIIIGSVHDPYQPVEQTEELTKKILQLIIDEGFSCHILTKSPLILRDNTLLASSDRCTVTMSIISMHPIIVNCFEPNTPSPQDRLNTVQMLQNKGIYTGVAIMPLIPFLVEDELNCMIDAIKASHAQYVLYKVLELKGDQKQIFFESIQAQFPHHYQELVKIYQNNIYAKDTYQKQIKEKMKNILKIKQIPSVIQMK